MTSTSEESEFTFSDGYKVYMKKWIPQSTPVAKLIFVHGYSDHMNRYYELFPTLANRGIAVTGWDQRGWGRSVKKQSDKGKTGPTAKILGDVVEVIKSELPSQVPVFVMGHSMGGGIVLTLASLPEYKDIVKEIRGWILESPLVCFPPSAQPNALKVFVGRLAGRILPHKQLYEKIDSATVSRDPAVMKSIDEDELCHATGTLEMFANMLDRAEALDSGKYTASEGVKSIILMHGTGDKSTGYDGSKRWVERHRNIKDLEFKTYDGWSHTLHSDLPDNRSVFDNDVADWILARVGKDDAATVGGGEQAKL